MGRSRSSNDKGNIQEPGILRIKEGAQTQGSRCEITGRDRGCHVRQVFASGPVLSYSSWASNQRLCGFRVLPCLGGGMGVNSDWNVGRQNMGSGNWQDFVLRRTWKVYYKYLLLIERWVPLHCRNSIKIFLYEEMNEQMKHWFLTLNYQWLK